MKTWQIALLLGVLVIGAVVVIKATSPSVAPKTGASPSTSNDLFASLVSLGVSAINNKPSAPSANPNAPVVPANFDTRNYKTEEGFMFTDKSGNFIAG